jgi:hypothetical protein
MLKVSFYQRTSCGDVTEQTRENADGKLNFEFVIIFIIFVIN